VYDSSVFANFTKRRAARLLTVVLLPVQNSVGWRHQQYSGIPQNEIAFSESGLTIGVSSSSSPVFFALKETVAVKKVEVTASSDGLPRLKTEKKEGAEGNDDYVLRIGLIAPGDYKPNWVERLLAPRWILDLVELAPPDTGLDKVRFLNISQETVTTEWTTRSKWIHDRAVKKVTTPGDLSFTLTLDPASPTMAIWVHADGDDTKSRFKTTIRKISLSP